MGRFINADSYASTGQGIIGNNMFAYCNNNPVFNSDPSGQMVVTGTFVVGITIFIFAVIVITSPQMQQITYNGMQQLTSMVSTAFQEAASIISVKRKSKTLPKTGNPDSIGIIENDDGTIKRRRKYNSSGEAEYDIDYNHQDDGTHDFPHVHMWIKGSRVKQPVDYGQFFNMLVEFL